MLNLPAKLADREEPIRTGVIGAGLFGTNLVDQLERAAGLEATAVADIEPEKGVETLVGAGVPREAVERVDGPDEADAVVANGRRAVLTDGVQLAATDVDVVVEATGVPAVGARHAYEAITAGTHVVMVTVEADTVVGPILATLARNRGVTYSMAYGDQPALIVELCDWAETVGLDVVAAGKGNPYRAEYRYGTPEDIFDRVGFDPAFVEEQDLNPRMYNSFYDGTKVAVEMCAVANAVGLKPDVPGMHLPAAEIPEIPELLRPEADGGLLDGPGVVDTVSSLYPDGTPVEHDVGFGVFVVTSTPTDRVRQYFAQYDGEGLYTASDGAYQLFYRPYHLPGVETGVSVATAALRNEPTGVPRSQETDVVGAAKRDLEPGDEIDGGGGYTVYGRLVDADAATEAGHVPLELLDGATVTGEVARDEVVTYDDVDLDETSFLYTLRQLQEETL
jgi:predicted homoserine dehydrogenase-like protein